jgi:hypothetical protein
MLEIITYTVLIAASLAAAVMMAKALSDSDAILAEMNREAEIDDAHRQRRAKVDAEMCRIFRAYGESRIRTIEAMGEIELNRIRNANK